MNLFPGIDVASVSLPVLSEWFHMPKGRPKKEFHEYIIDGEGRHVLHQDYVNSPATAFLKYTVEAKDAVNHCHQHFQKKKDGTFSKAALDSLQHILSAFLPAIMGHFETYQRYLFAGVFERSSLLQDFRVDDFFRQLKKETSSLEIDPVMMSAYRGFSASAGILLADSLSGWHNPEKVNRYFDAFGFNVQFFSNDDCRRLRTLWQLRHSIVHTGGTITIPDAQKVKDLSAFGDNPIVFDNQFVFEVSRKMHPLVGNATDRIAQGFKKNMLVDVPRDENNAVENLFEVKVPVPVWLK